jgi:putative transposase
MQTIRTFCCKLDPLPEQRTAIDAMLAAFADACNAIAEVSRSIGSTNRVTVHHACYRDVRERFGLSANHAIRAIARVCTTLKVPKKAGSTFAPTSIDLDVRTFRFHEADWSFGVTLLAGRQRLATTLGNFQRKALAGRTPTSATLVKRRDGGYYIHVQLVDEAPSPEPMTEYLGIDLGIVNLATDSDRETFSGSKVDAVRRRYSKHRRGLNKRGTKSISRSCRSRRRPA